MASNTWSDWGSANSYSKGKLVVTSTSNGAASNSSQVTATLYARRTDSATSYNNSKSYFWITIDGTDSYRTSGIKISGSSWQYVHSFTKTVYHGADGKKQIYVAAGGNIPSTSFNIGNSGNFTFVLDAISLLPNYTLWENTSISHTSATFKWEADVECDEVQYQIGSGTWMTTPFSKTVTINNLSPGTSYNIRISVKKKNTDNNWRNSSYITVNTTPIASLTNGNSLNFDIGSDVVLRFVNYDKNASNIKMAVEQQDGTYGADILNVTSPSGNETYTIQTSSIAPVLKQNAANKNSIKVRIVVGVVIGGTFYGNTYYAIATVTGSNPTFSNFTYAVTDSKISSLLGNSSYAIENNGEVQATISTSNKAVAKDSATIIKYLATITDSSNTIIVTKEAKFSSTASVNINFGKMTNKGTYSINICAIDSRGNTSTVIKKPLTVLEYSRPKASIKLNRFAEYEAEIEVQLTAVYSRLLISGTQKNNGFSIRYRYAETGTSNWSSITTVDPKEYTQTDSTSNPNDKIVTFTRSIDKPLVTLDTNKSYNFEFFIDDGVVSDNKITISLAQGIPIMVEADNGMVAVGRVPDWNSTALFQVGSDILAKDTNGNDRKVMETMRNMVISSKTEPSQMVGGVWLIL